MGTCDSGTSLFAMNAFQRGLPPSSRRKDCLLAGSLPSTHTVWERSFKKTTRLHDPFPPPLTALTHGAIPVPSVKHSAGKRWNGQKKMEQQ